MYLEILPTDLCKECLSANVLISILIGNTYLNNTIKDLLSNYAVDNR